MRRSTLCAIFSLLFTFATVSAAVDQVVVRSVIFEGVKKLPLTEQQRIIGNVQQHVQKQSDLAIVAEMVQYGFQRDGFAHVRVQDPTVRVVARNGDQETVDLIIDVQEGEQYRLKEIRFSGSSEFPESVLRAQFPIADGEIFNREKIGLGLQGLRNLYMGKGYPDFSAVPQTEEDRAQHTIVLVIDIRSGQQSGM